MRVLINRRPPVNLILSYDSLFSFPARALEPPVRYSVYELGQLAFAVGLQHQHF